MLWGTGTEAVTEVADSPLPTCPSSTLPSEHSSQNVHIVILSLRMHSLEERFPSKAMRNQLASPPHTPSANMMSSQMIHCSFSTTPPISTPLMLHAVFPLLGITLLLFPPPFPPCASLLHNQRSAPMSSVHPCLPLLPYQN